MTADKSTADLVVGDQAVMLPGGSGSALIVTVSRVTKAQLIVEAGTNRTLRFNRATGRQVGGQHAWRPLALLHPESDRGREWARTARLDRARAEAKSAIGRLVVALSEGGTTPDDEVLGMSGDVASAVRHYLRARKDGAP